MTMIWASFSNFVLGVVAASSRGQDAARTAELHTNAEYALICLLPVATFCKSHPDA
jgi:hypothetical protein